MMQQAIASLIEGENLPEETAGHAMLEIMQGQATNAQIGAFLTALRIKGETVEELVAFAKAMRKSSCVIYPNAQGRLVDTCGTGGDKLKTFNVSTTAAFVAAGAGVPIAKHGNRSVTSKSGSADVLEQLGINLNASREMVQKAIEQVGVGFMFAPVFHPAMKYAVAPRKELGVRTVFNLLGPLTNPACAEAQVLGVYHPKLTEAMAKALSRLGCEEAIVVHGLNGLDEISTLGKTVISHLKNGEIKTRTLSPHDLGVKQAKLADLQAASPQENATLLLKILKDQTCDIKAKTDMVLVNSAAALIVGEKACDFKEGVELARQSIQSGQAYGKLKALIMASGGDLARLEEFERA